jgi:hypothetical protein
MVYLERAKSRLGVPSPSRGARSLRTLFTLPDSRWLDFGVLSAIRTIPFARKAYC